MAVTINGDTGVTTPGISNSEGYTGDGLTIAAGAPSGAVAVNSSGNVGIGTSSPTTLLELKSTTSTVGLSITADNASTSDINLGDEDDINIQRIRSDHSDNSLQFHTNNAERARIDSSGNLLVGTTSGTGKLAVAGNMEFQASNSLSASGTNPQIGRLNSNGTLNIATGEHASSAMLFYTGSPLAERARIDSSGNLLVGATTPIGSNGHILASSDYTSTYRSTTTSGAYVHAFASDIGGTRTVKYAVYANGTAAAVSDKNFKKNIEPARNYLDDLMKIEVVKYNWKTDEDSAPKELGYIAQQVETVFAGIVDEQTYKDGDGNEVTQKMLKKEVFVPMMLKAIQELKAELDTVKTELATLKGQ